MWDLPGGGREGLETPEGCGLRELHEEFGLILPASRLLWGATWPAMSDAQQTSWFFAGLITPEEIAAIRFGDEGQFWQMMPVRTFLTHPNSIPALQDRTRIALQGLGWPD